MSDKLKKMLRNLDKTQDDMAVATGLSRFKILQILNGQHLNITLKTFFLISNFLGVSEINLLKILKEEMNRHN